jgi:hypothetical protein
VSLKELIGSVILSSHGITFLLLLINIAMAKYSKAATEKVEKALHEEKRGTLSMGKSGNKVTSRKQAIAIGLSEARKEGAKVPDASMKTSKARNKS